MSIGCLFPCKQDSWVLNSLAVEEDHCYNSVKALPPDVIAQRIDNPDYMQWDSSCEISSVFLKGTQFNVQTLVQFSTRKNLLANFIKQRFAIGCFQEARSKTGRARMIDNVVMLASTADRGNYGCEVWVNPASPVGVKSGKKIFLTRDGVTAVYSDPRILIVKCRTTKIEMYIISAHAPYCKSPTDCTEACEWWAKFSTVVSSTCSKGIPVLIGIDANYVVHNDASSGIGEVCRSGVPPPITVVFVSF